MRRWVEAKLSEVSNETLGLMAIILAISMVVWLFFHVSGYNLGRTSIIVSVAQGIATVTAIGFGGLFAYQKLNIFRTFYTHLNTWHEISHRSVSNSYVHISVTVILQNN